MKICILGSGALGSALGGMLKTDGSDVYLIDVWQEHVDAINRNGLALNRDGIERAIPLKAATNAVGLGTMDLVVVSVKSYDTEAAMSSALSVVGEHTSVLSLQSGLGNEEILSNFVGGNRLLAGRTEIQASTTAPGAVSTETRNKKTWIGTLATDANERGQAISDAFNRADIDIALTDNILGVIWDRLLMDAAAGALSAITRRTYGELCQMPKIGECAQEAIVEGIRTAKAHGIRLSVDAPDQIWRNVFKGVPADHRHRVLRNMEKHKKTEVDFINGAVVRYGKMKDIPTPVNKTLAACIAGIEYGKR